MIKRFGKSLILVSVAGGMILIASQWMGPRFKKIDTEFVGKNEAERAVVDLIKEVRTGDIDEVIKRGTMRVLVSYNQTHYFVDHGQEYGLAYEVVTLFEQYLREKYAKQRAGQSFSVVFIPVSRDEIFEKLNANEAEIAVANLTVTTERAEKADFSNHTFDNVRELVVTQKDEEVIDSIEDLAGMDITVRPSSSFWVHLEGMKKKLIQLELDPIELIPAEEYMETGDLVQMVDGGLIDATIIDSHLTDFWGSVYTNIQIHDQMPISPPQKIAWAVRKNMPKLMKEVNRFIHKNRAGTLIGNVIKNRYLHSQKWVDSVKDTMSDEGFNALQSKFAKYCEKYDLDPLLIMAQAYQESRLDQNQRSSAGAVGIMQLLPSTGEAMEVGDINELEPNIHAGVKYMRKIMDTYFDDADIDGANKRLFALASYNAGPTRIKKLRAQAEKQGLDPNVWFGQVEKVVARKVGQEPIHYVSRISKLFIAYRLSQKRKAIHDEFVESVSAVF